MILRKCILRILSLACLLSLVSGVLFVQAEDLTSSNFILRNSTLTIEGGNSSSAHFQYFSSSGQISSGESASGDFIQRAGFEYFADATTPIISATPGNAQVSLTWTASASTLANVSGYYLGTSTTLGGPYTFQDVGNVLLFTKASLTNGTPYYFVVTVRVGGESIVQSSEVTATPTGPVVPPTPPPPAPPPTSGGGGVPPPPPASPATGVQFSGRAFPLSKVTLLKDGQTSVNTVAGPDANFTISLMGLSAGNYVFSVVGEDSEGKTSQSFLFPITVTSGATTNVSGIFIAPTIDVDKKEVARGENIAIFGQSVPSGSITISVHSTPELFLNTKSDKNGVYLYNFDTTPLDKGTHETKSKVAYKKEISPFGKTVNFSILSGKPPVKTPTDNCGRADLNCDGHVNLVDFSIAAYWNQRPITDPEFLAIEASRLNGDGKIDLVDFSIMAYYWTG